MYENFPGYAYTNLIYRTLDARVARHLPTGAAGCSSNHRTHVTETFPRNPALTMTRNGPPRS